MLHGTSYVCHTCYDPGRAAMGNGQMVANVAPESSEFTLGWLCVTHLFDAVRDGLLLVSYANYGPAAFDQDESHGYWACYATDCPDSHGDQRVGLLEEFPYELSYLCETCLMRLVIEGTLVITEPGVQAAPTGPTANYNKDTGTVEIDGLTFRW